MGQTYQAGEKLENRLLTRAAQKRWLVFAGTYRAATVRERLHRESFSTVATSSQHTVQLAQHLTVEFWFAVECHETVDFLLDVGNLRVADAGEGQPCNRFIQGA